jgi:hypothetical protein
LTTSASINKAGFGTSLYHYYETADKFYFFPVRLLRYLYTDSDPRISVTVLILLFSSVSFEGRIRIRENYYGSMRPKILGMLRILIWNTAHFQCCGSGSGVPGYRRAKMTLKN